MFLYFFNKLRERMLLSDLQFKSSVLCNTDKLANFYCCSSHMQGLHVKDTVLQILCIQVQLWSLVGITCNLGLATVVGQFLTGWISSSCCQSGYTCIQLLVVIWNTLYFNHLTKCTLVSIVGKSSEALRCLCATTCSKVDWILIRQTVVYPFAQVPCTGTKDRKI